MMQPADAASRPQKPRPLRRPSTIKKGLPPLDPKVSALRRTAQVAAWLYAAFAIINSLTGNLIGTICGTAIIICAFLPTYLWVMQIAKGYPVYPLFAATFSYTFGLQMLLNHEIMILASTEGILSATFAVCGFLLLGTVVWLPMVRKERPAPKELKMIAGRRADITFSWIFAAAACYQVAYTAGWAQQIGEYNTILRAIMFSFGTMSAFALSYHLGEKKLTAFMRAVFLVSLAIYLLAAAATLMLVQPLSLGLLAAVGYIIASKKIPWKAFAIGLPLFGLMQYGKYAVREQYWDKEGSVSFSPQPWQYPKLYADWIRSASRYGQHKEELDVEKNSSLLKRSSLLHIFLYAHSLSPNKVPYLHGETYKILPMLLIPRFLLQNKPASHESTYLLNIHYGIQTREDTGRTTIGWGLFNEALANFGFLGLAMLAVVLAWFFGMITQYSMGCPLLSFRGFLAVLVMSYAFQSEYSSGVFVSALFQSYIALLAMSFLIMQNVRFRPEEINTLTPPGRTGAARLSRPAVRAV